MKTKNSFLLLLFLVCAAHLHAQSRLSGEILERSSTPVPGAVVYFNNGKQYALSDNDGKFSLSFPDTLASRSIRVQAYGYKTKTMVINRGQEYVKVILLDSTLNLRAVNVVASRHGRFSDYSAQTVQMSSFDIVTNPSAMADLMGNMRVLPGVQTNDNDGRLIIQGGSPDESKYYINELIVANPYTVSSKNSGVRSRFSSDLFEGIALQSGGFNAEFGHAMSGIVNLNTKEKEQMDPKTDVSVSPIFVGLAHINKGASHASRANVMYNDMSLYSKMFPDDHEWTKPFRQLSADLFLTKEFSSRTKMTAQGNGSASGGSYSYENVDGQRFHQNMKEFYLYAQANLYHAFTDKLSLTAAGNVIVNRLSVTEVRYKDDKISNRSLWSHSKLNLQYRSGKITNRTGVEFICNPFDETYSYVSDFHSQDYRTDIKNNVWSVYNDTKVFLTENFTASLGLRGEYSDYLKRFNWAPRLYAAYRFNREHILSASVGKYFQLPSMEYLKISDGIDFTSAGKGTLSYSYVKRREKLQVDVYYKSYDKLVTYEHGTFTPEHIASRGTGYAYGSDIFWKSNFKRLEYWLSYSFNHTKKQYAGFAEKVAPPYVASHSFNLTLKYWIAPLKSLVGGACNVAAGAPYYSDSAPYEALGVTPFRNRVDVSWSFLPKEWIVVHFGCTNVLGRRNVYGYEYSRITPGLRREITSPEKRFLFAGVFVTFSNNKKLNQLKDL